MREEKLHFLIVEAGLTMTSDPIFYTKAEMKAWVKENMQVSRTEFPPKTTDVLYWQLHKERLIYSDEPLDEKAQRKHIVEILLRWNGYYRLTEEGFELPWLDKKCRCNASSMRGLLTSVKTGNSLRKHMRHIFGQEPKGDLAEFWEKHGKFLGPAPEFKKSAKEDTATKRTTGNVEASVESKSLESDLELGKKRSRQVSDPTEFEDESSVREGNEEKSNDASERGKGEKKTRYLLFFGNLPYDTKVQDMEKLLEGAGIKALGIRIPNDKNTFQPQGFAFIDFHNSRDLHKALSLHNTEMGNRRINVELTVGGRGNSEERRKRIVERRQSLAQERAKKMDRQRRLEAKAE